METITVYTGNEHEAAFPMQMYQLPNGHFIILIRKSDIIGDCRNERLADAGHWELQGTFDLKKVKGAHLAGIIEIFIKVGLFLKERGETLG